MNFVRFMIFSVGLSVTLMGLAQEKIEEWRNRVVIKGTTCQLCFKDFSSRWNAENHIKEVHIGIKPFTCGTCEAIFTRFNSAKVHIKRRHPNDPVVIRRKEVFCKFVNDGLDTYRIASGSNDREDTGEGELDIDIADCFDLWNELE